MPPAVVRSNGTCAGVAGNRPHAPPTSASPISSVGNPLQTISARTGGRIPPASRNVLPPVKSRSNRGERTATRAPSRREKERRSGFPATSASRTETEAASAGASDRRARSRSWNSHPRLQKYERAWSSAKTGSETTRVYPSSSVAYARAGSDAREAIRFSSGSSSLGLEASIGL